METAEDVANAIIDRVGKNIVLGLPLGLGKANHIANALTERALRDESIKLTILTALTLEIPTATSELEKRFFEPARQRLFGDYPGLRYVELLRNRSLPKNIEINEFFLMAGQWMNNNYVQQQFLPANYTHALSFLKQRNVNVIAQLITKRSDKCSLSCNPDITADLLELRRKGELDFVFAAQVNNQLPFMFGDTEIEASEIDLMLDGSKYEFDLYSAPKRKVEFSDHAIGLHVARLLKDGGTLQIGIGSIGDAIANALILRHKKSSEYKKLIKNLSRDLSQLPLHADAFDIGLHGVSEMFVDGFLQLAEAGVLKREVDGAWLHAAFFVETHGFYRKLREMDDEKRARFIMKPVSFTNALYGNEDYKRETRQSACFVNNAMMVTLRGATISDALEDGRVVSGVGGQFDFVTQAFALKDARSVITINATRKYKGKVISNIVWDYAHHTIPWHLKDIVVTEYGVADVRGKSESETVKSILKIADSRFQPELLSRAKKAGKVENSWQIPEANRNNPPEQLIENLNLKENKDLLPPFPFGSDFTTDERRLLPALELLKEKRHSRIALFYLMLKGFLSKTNRAELRACLERMQLYEPDSLKAYCYKYVLIGALLRAQNARW